jgi:regulatory protein YycI of two-component signal transduction system YycFG
MIIFPEGKTQKYCKLTIKIFIIIYIINNIFFKGSIMFDEFINNMPENTYTYEREINIKNIDDKLINSINDDIFKGEDVIKNIVINFTDELNIKAIITVDKFLDNDEINNLKSDIAKIFEIDTGNVEINI